MSCPRCGSNDLWDDNLWWGCNTCGYAGNESGGSMIFAKNIPGLARSVAEVRRNPAPQWEMPIDDYPD